MRTIAIAQAKGGVGKTTTAVNLAAGLARQGSQVLLIDADVQNQAAQFLGLPTPTIGFGEFVRNKVDVTAGSVMGRENLWLMAGGLGLVRLKTHLGVIKDNSIKMDVVRKKLELGPDCLLDYIIFDMSPGWDILSLNILMASDEIISPLNMDWLSVNGLSTFLGYARGVLKERASFFKFRILPTIYDRRVRKSGEVLAHIMDKYKNVVLEPIRYSSKLAESPHHGQTIFEYAPRSTGAVDYSALVQSVAQP